MQIVERYLHAIEFWLPRQQSRDIIAEISEDLHSQIEDREEELGRKLSETELEALIKQRGRPVLVANRYQAQRFLIGPALFPIYVFVLKIFALCYLIPQAAVVVTVHRVQHPASPWIDTISSAAGSLWTGSFIGAGVITLVFAVLQVFETRQGWLEEWNPRQLPRARQPGRIPRADSIFELVICVAATAWWIGHASTPNILNGPHVQLVLSPRWMWFFWGFFGVAVLHAALAAVNLRRPYWTRARAVARLAFDAAGGALFCWLVQADLIETLRIADVEPSRALEIANAIRLWMGRAFPLAVIAVVATLAPDIYRVVRVGKQAEPAIPADCAT
jgi:hypothetical protein